MIDTNLSAQLLIHFTAATAAIFIRFTSYISQQAIQFTAAIVRLPLAFLAVAVAVSLRLLAPTHAVPVSIPSVDSPGLATIASIGNSIQLIGHHMCRMPSNQGRNSRLSCRLISNCTLRARPQPCMIEHASLLVKYKFLLHCT